MRNNQSIIFATDTKDYICPVCGEEYNSRTSDGLIVSVPEYAGVYCLKCWAKWISENIPKCVNKEKTMKTNLFLALTLVAAGG
jgi:ribosomal protein L37AE/L43A